jgi:hypothetical protein
VALTLATIPALADPILEIEAETLLVRELPAGAEVALFGVDRDLADGWTTVVTRTAEIGVDDDGDGTVRFELGREVPPMGVWVAVELATGASAAATSPDFEAGPLAQPVELGSDLAGDPASVRTAGRLLDVFLVRPGEAEAAGAWQASAANGGPADAEVDDEATLAVPAERLEALTPGLAATETFAAGDVLVLIDPETLRWRVLTLDEDAQIVEGP